MSASSLFNRVRTCSHVPRAEHASPLAQLEAVGNFVADMQAALRELRGSPHQGPLLKSPGLQGQPQGQQQGRPPYTQQTAAGQQAGPCLLSAPVPGSAQVLISG